MNKNISNNTILTYVSILCISTVLLANLSVIKIYVDTVTLGWLLNMMMILTSCIIIPFIKNGLVKHYFFYVLIMLLGFVFHYLTNVSIKPINDSYKWIYLVFVIVAVNKYNSNKLFFYLIISLLLIHSVLAIYENRTQSHPFDYSFVENFENIEDNAEFRSFGLMEHPLYAANISIIILAFVLVNNNIKKTIKYSLLFIGTYAIFTFNSRAAIIIWATILFYKLFLYKINWIYSLLFALFIYFFFLSDIALFVQQNASIFGRLSETTKLNDSSSLSRLISYILFWEHNWSVEEILTGGLVIYIPGTELSLENGILLTVAWWGWIIGPLKVVLEVFICYKLLNSMNLKDKIIILLATWGTAFANNNSINTFVFAFFILSYFSIGKYKIQQNIQ